MSVKCRFVYDIWLQYILCGCTFNILSFALNSTVRADGNPKLASLTMIIGCGTNIVLDYLFVFVLNIGIKGAAFATVISQALTFFIILYYYTKGNSNHDDFCNWYSPFCNPNC